MSKKNTPPADHVSEGFPRIGADPETGPVDTSRASEGKGSWRWTSAQSKKGDDTPSVEDRGQGWVSTATEELSRFRGVPVVGRLPWRVQYFLALGGMLIGTIIMLSMATSGRTPAVSVNPIEKTLRQSISVLGAQADLVRQGRPVDAQALALALQEGGKAAAAADAKVAAAWKPVQAASTDVGRLSAQVASVRSDADRARLALGQGLQRITPQWERANSEGLLTSPDAVALAQVIGAFRTWTTTLELVLGRSGNLPVGLAAEVQTINQGFASFRQSPNATLDNGLTQAWREAANAWGLARSPAEALVGSAADWNQLQGSLQSLASSLSTLNAVVNSLTVGAVQSGGHGAGAWLAGLLALCSLGLFVAIVWKQQRWQVLQAKANNEQVDAAIFEMMQDLQLVGSGDLTKLARVSDLPIGTLADSINHTVGQLRKLVVQVKKTTEATSSASLQANESTGVLIDSARQHLQALDSSGRDLLRLTGITKTGADEAAEAGQLSQEAQVALATGRTAVEQSQESMRDVRERVEEVKTRTERIADSSKEIAGIAQSMEEIAEQTEVLAMQASLQAAKAGPSGQGFRVVAKGVQELAEASGSKSRQVASLMEAILSDLDALLLSMRSAIGRTDESARLTDVSHEAWSVVDEKLGALSDRVLRVRELTSEQNQIAEQLDDKTKNELGRVEQSLRQTQEAAEAVVKMVDAVRVLGDSATRFKV